MAKVIVAMSGGVDSAVTAALLIEQGFSVQGLTLQLWHASRTEQKGIERARQVAAQLGIPLHVQDVRESFQREVVQSFIKSHLSNETPNPCVLCNRALKWSSLLDFADEQNAAFVATGHYARILQSSDGKVELWRASDLAKDQSYMLSNLTQRELERSILPLGELRKPEVRAIAQSLGLTVSETPDSQDLCFLDREDYQDFLRKNAPSATQPGEICTTRGQLLGTHQGLGLLHHRAKKRFAGVFRSALRTREENRHQHPGPLAQPTNWEAADSSPDRSIGSVEQLRIFRWSAALKYAIGQTPYSQRFLIPVAAA